MTNSARFVRILELICSQILPNVCLVFHQAIKALRTCFISQFKKYPYLEHLTAPFLQFHEIITQATRVHNLNISYPQNAGKGVPRHRHWFSNIFLRGIPRTTLGFDWELKGTTIRFLAGSAPAWLLAIGLTIFYGSIKG